MDQDRCDHLCEPGRLGGGTSVWWLGYVPLGARPRQGASTIASGAGRGWASNPFTHWSSLKYVQANSWARHKKIDIYGNRSRPCVLQVGEGW